MTKFNIGETAWLARCSRQPINKELDFNERHFSSWQREYRKKIKDVYR